MGQKEGGHQARLAAAPQERVPSEPTTAETGVLAVEALCQGLLQSRLARTDPCPATHLMQRVRGGGDPCAPPRCPF